MRHFSFISLTQKKIVINLEYPYVLTIVFTIDISNNQPIVSAWFRIALVVFVK